MKFLLLYPPIWERTGWITSCNNGIGLISIAAVLRERGHAVRVIDAEVYGWNTERILSEIDAYKPTHIGISALSTGLESAIILSKTIKEKYPNIWISMGGAGPSSEPERALSESGADSIAIGESELILDAVFSKPGIHNGIPCEDLDSLPDPAYDLLEPKIGSSYWRGNDPRPVLQNTKEIMTMWSRGCPHLCTFCSKATIKRGMPRMRSPKRISEELRMLNEKFGINSVFVYDDELIGMGEKNNDWLKEVCAEISTWNDNKVVLKGQGRCSKRFVDFSVCESLKKANFFAMMMGCESGSEKVKRRIRKGTTNDDIRHTLKILTESGIKVFGFWMIGMPEETRNEARETERLVVEMTPYMEWIQVTVFAPLRGSDFWNEAIENKWLENFDDTLNFQRDPMLNMPWMSQNEIAKWQRKLYMAFHGTREMSKNG